MLLYFDPLEPPYKYTYIHITVINILEVEDEVLSCLLNVVFRELSLRFPECCVF